MTNPDWLAQVRQRQQAAAPAYGRLWFIDDIECLLRCAEALAELVAMNAEGSWDDDAATEAAWEAAEAALRGEQP